MGIYRRDGNANIYDLMVTSGMLDANKTLNPKDFDGKKAVEILEKMANFPFVDTGEWLRILSTGMIKQAILDGATQLTIQHPHENGAGSGLPWTKANAIYGTLHPAAMRDIAKRNKIPEVPRQPMTPDLTEPNYLKLLEYEKLSKDNLSKFAKPIQMQISSNTGDIKAPWIALADEAKSQLRELILKTHPNVGRDTPTLDFILRQVEYGFNTNESVSNSTNSGLHMRVTGGGDDKARNVSIFGNGIMTVLENGIIKVARDAVVHTTPTSIEAAGDSFISKAVRPLEQASLNVINKLNLILYANERDGVDTVNYKEKIKEYLEANKDAIDSAPRIKALVETLGAFLEQVEYAKYYVRHVYEYGNTQSIVAGFSNLNEFRNQLMRNRGTTFQLKGVDGASNVAANPNPMFKLDTGGGAELKVGDWSWRNALIGNLAKRHKLNNVAVQFSHENIESKVIATLRLVSLTADDAPTEDGKPVVVTARMDRQSGVAYETFENESDVRAWVAVASEEMDLRMRVLGARYYSRETLSMDMVENKNFATIGRGKEKPEVVDDTNVSEDTPQLTERPAPKLATDEKPPIGWSAENTNNGTMISSAQGYFIAVINNKFRLYGANKTLVGVYATEQEAKRKAEALRNKGTKR